MKKKSLNVLKKKADLKNTQLHQMLRQSKIYKLFRERMLNCVGNQDFSIGVSGGPDSLCLAYFSKLYVSEFKNNFFVFIVNHKIRKNSGIEALKVQKILKKQNISSTILVNEGNTPNKNIQLNAREIRYSLIAKKCLKYKLNFLVTAHHQDDQVENFLIRLFRGSGLTGLASMSEQSYYNKNLKLVRPFLNIEKRYLKIVSKQVFKTFIIDPSNYDEIYLRTRIRRYRKTLDSEGFDTKKIIKTISNLKTAKTALEFYKNKAIKRYVKFYKNKNCKINIKLFSLEADEVIFRLFSTVLSLTAETYYPPRSKKIMNIINSIKNKEITKKTLGRCIIEKTGNYIFFIKEPKKYLKISKQSKND